MKRRGDEVQFGARGAPPRILTTQHNAGMFVSSISPLLTPLDRISGKPISNLFLLSAAGPTIQYQIGPGVLKTNVSENPSLAGSQQPAVQYTCKSSRAHHQ